MTTRLLYNLVREKYSDEELLSSFYKPISLGSQKSPLREDRKPSFGFYYSNGLRFKDFATGKSGTVFDFLCEVYNLSFDELLLKIWQNESLVEAEKAPSPIKKKTEIIIQRKDITKTDYDYWSSYHIKMETLDKFNVIPCKYVDVNGHILCYHYKNPIYAYRNGPGYQIYRPYDKKFKWASSLNARCVHGLEQLAYQSDLLVITKSLKDVMVLYELGVESVSPISENVLIPKDILENLEKRYKYIFVLFDNDMKHNGDLYPYPKFYVKHKDISDHIKAEGYDETYNTIYEICQQVREIEGRGINGKDKYALT